jgi:deoxyadenosine/deoxycytidine kinase
MAAPVIVSLEGLPGSGKTTTAKLVADLAGMAYAHERSADVPFLDAFYSAPERYKLETELCFVLVHYHQYRDLEESAVLDFSPVKDLVFADLNLAGSDREVFRSVYDRTSGSLPRPDAAVFLDLDHGHLLERIAARGRPFERDFPPAYLKGLGEMYERHFEDLGKAVGRVQVTRPDSPAEVAEAVQRTLHDLLHLSAAQPT